MKRILSSATLAGAVVAAVLLTALSPISPQAAHAGPLERALYGGYYDNGGYAPGYGGYAGYGYSPYGYGGYSGYGRSSTYGYADVAPRAYVYPSYRSYGFGNGFGTGATYRGVVDYRYGGSGPYGQPYRAAYSPYGYGGYGPYGF
jgi:hypothetical protein